MMRGMITMMTPTVMMTFIIIAAMIMMTAMVTMTGMIMMMTGAENTSGIAVVSPQTR